MTSTYNSGEEVDSPSSESNGKDDRGIITATKTTTQTTASNRKARLRLTSCCRLSCSDVMPESVPFVCRCASENCRSIAKRGSLRFVPSAPGAFVAKEVCYITSFTSILKGRHAQVCLCSLLLWPLHPIPGCGPKF